MDGIGKIRKQWPKAYHLVLPPQENLPGTDSSARWENEDRVLECFDTRLAEGVGECAEFQDDLNR
jgi:hypothetical protein